MPEACSVLSRLFAVVLALSLSLGALPCAAAGMDDAGSPPACCAPDDGDGERGAPASQSDPGSALSACPGACPGSALPHSVAPPANPTLALAPAPRDAAVAGRSLAPDPPPPRSSSAT